MSANAIEWIAVLIFFLFFWGFNFAEALWLSKRGWAAFGKSLAFSVTSNLLGFFTGSAVVFIVILILFMLVFEPIPNATANEAVAWSGVVLALIFPPIFLMLLKRLLLKVFKMDSGRPAWGFSAISAVFVVFASVAVPSLFLYIVLKFAR